MVRMPKQVVIPEHRFFDRLIGVEITRVDDAHVEVNGRRHTIETGDDGRRFIVAPSGNRSNVLLQSAFQNWLQSEARSCSWWASCIDTIEASFTRPFTQVTEVIQTRWGMAILRAIYLLGLHDGNTSFQFKDLCHIVAMLFGAETEEDAHHGVCFHPYTKRQINKNLGAGIATWIEERSPHSRQRYWFANRRVYWTEKQRPLLFINPGLAEANAAKGWRPYSYVRGNGWYLNPVEAKRWFMEDRPSEQVLQEADLVFDNPPPKKDGTLRVPKRGGLRGAAANTHRAIPVLACVY